MPSQDDFLQYQMDRAADGEPLALSRPRSQGRPMTDERVSSSSELSALLVAGLERTKTLLRESVAALVLGDPELLRVSQARLGDAIGRGLLLGDLIGQADAELEAEAAGKPPAPDDDEPLTFARLDSDPPELAEVGPFISGTFLEALENMRGRVPRLRTTIDDMRARRSALGRALAQAASQEALVQIRARSQAINEALRRSFWVSKTDVPTTVNLRRLVADALRGKDAETSTLPDFIDQAALEGAGHLTDAHLETVWRNNLQGAYNQGRTAVLSSVETQAVMPLSMILEIRDTRTRPAHWQMHGYVNRVEYLQRRRLIPPNGHNCRASLTGLSRSRCRRMGLLDENDQIDEAALREYNGDRQLVIDAGEYPDPGFD